MKRRNFLQLGGITPFIGLCKFTESELLPEKPVFSENIIELGLCNLVVYIESQVKQTIFIEISPCRNFSYDCKRLVISTEQRIIGKNSYYFPKSYEKGRYLRVVGEKEYLAWAETDLPMNPIFMLHDGL